MITLRVRRGAPSLRELDLHLHSWHSDGTLAPAELARRVSRAGVKLAALTDHDCLAGTAEFAREGRLHGLATLPGVEVSCACAELLPLRAASGAAASSSPIETHILVYGIEAGDGPFEEFLAAIRAMRRERVAAMAARLHELGLPIELAPLRARLETGSVGRPHLARALIAAGHVKNLGEAFHAYLAEGRPGWLPKQLPEARELLSLARARGGVCVLAHPGKALPEGSAKMLIDMGIDGLEAHHPSHRSALRQELEQLARRNNLSVSAGSDFHDPVQGRYKAPEVRRDSVGGRLQHLLDAR